MEQGYDRDEPDGAQTDDNPNPIFVLTWKAIDPGSDRRSPRAHRRWSRHISRRHELHGQRNRLGAQERQEEPLRAKGLGPACRALAAAACICFALSFDSQAVAAPEPPAPEGLPASSWILIDPESGDILASQDPGSAFPIASATKLMTYYVAAERLRPDREVVVAPYDAIPAESLAGIEPGDTLTARDLFYGLLVPSGNDAAATLALAVSGSETDFVTRMNSAAKDLGLSDTEYVDPIGIGSQNVSSAADLVDLAVELQEQELFREIVDTEEVTLRSAAEPIRLQNRNTLVLDQPFVNGIKTGTTIDAGFVLVGSGERNGVELVSAVLGAPDALSRDSATLSLLDYGFSLYDKRTLVTGGQKVGSVPLADGSGRLPLEAADAVSEIARQDEKVGFSLEGVEPVVGPLAKGASLGSVVVRLGGRKVAEVNALASRAVAAPREPSSADGGGLPPWAWVVFAGAGFVAAVLAGVAIAVHRRR